MKRLLIFIMIVSLLGFNTMAYAAEDTTVDPGITPDSFLYTADQLYEDLKLAFTFDSEEEANLLLQFAQERLSEAKLMTEDEKTEFVKTAVNDYMEIMDQVQEKVLEAITDEGMDQEVKEEIMDQLIEVVEVEEEIQENLDDEVKEELEEKTQEINFAANVVKDIDVEIVKSLREKDLGFGQIAHIVLLSKMSGKSLDEVANLFNSEDKGLGDVAKELGIEPSEIKGKAKENKPIKSNEVKETNIESVVASNQDQTDSLENNKSEDIVKKDYKKEERKIEKEEFKAQKQVKKEELKTEKEKKKEENKIEKEKQKQELKEKKQEKKEELKIEKEKK